MSTGRDARDWRHVSLEYGDQVELDAGPCLLRPWQPGDRHTLTEAANDYEVWRNLADRFPHPYTLDDADRWIATCVDQGEPPHNLTIVVGDQAVGGIGIELLEGEKRMTANIGYWLARMLWNKGIVTAALSTFTEYAWSSFEIERLQASVFAWNPASVRVLEKCGYRLEGRLRRAFIKEGEVTDELVYGFVRGDQADLGEQTI